MAMTIDEISDILSLIEYQDYVFHVFDDGGAIYLQASYFEPGIITKAMAQQTTRKWQLSRNMVKSEIVQTAFLCALTSAEHRVREHFLYRGERIFGPHFDVDGLYELCKEKRLDYRGRKKGQN